MEPLFYEEFICFGVGYGVFFVCVTRKGVGGIGFFLVKLFYNMLSLGFSYLFLVKEIWIPRTPWKVSFFV